MTYYLILSRLKAGRFGCWGRVQDVLRIMACHGVLVIAIDFIRAPARLARRISYPTQLAAL